MTYHIGTQRNNSSQALGRVPSVALNNGVGAGDGLAGRRLGAGEPVAGSFINGASDPDRSRGSLGALVLLRLPLTLEDVVVGAARGHGGRGEVGLVGGEVVDDVLDEAGRDLDAGVEHDGAAGGDVGVHLRGGGREGCGGRSAEGEERESGGGETHFGFVGGWWRAVRTGRCLGN